ncbi:MAG TPA: ECF-type sigma factor [Gemmataceae bacterium]|nr:ECF-type sigma factor [Gemmataceae bacterium]
MSSDPPKTVSRLLGGVQRGDAASREQLAQLMAVELRRQAESVLQRERAGHTLQPADLVQEVFLRLLEGDVLENAPNRAYLFGAASTALRRVLVDHARKRGAARRGGGQNRVPLLDDALDRYARDNLDLLALNDALETLQTLHPRQCQIVEEYHFGGYTLKEIAEHLGVSEATVSVELKRAQLWLAARLGGAPQ